MSAKGAPRFRTLSVAVMLFLSGSGALAFEALWFRQARLAFGNTVWAAAAVTGSFMVGLAVGSALVARSRLSTRASLRVYAGLELTIALLGCALARGLPALASELSPLFLRYADQPVAVSALRFGSSLVLLSIPSIAMGMTLPLAVRGLGTSHAVGRTLGALYGANTLGAAVGTLAVELVLIEQLGMTGSALTAAGASILAALLAVGMTRAVEPAVLRPEEALAKPLPVSSRWLVAAALAGFAMLGLEVVWLRFLMLFLSDTPTAFAVILALVLLSIALGSLLASAYLARRPGAARHADLLLLSGGASIALALVLFPHVLTRFFSLEQGGLEIALVAFPLVVPTSLASGAVFPLLVARHFNETRNALRATAEVTCANTVGGALGATLTALVILPALGMERAFLVFVALFAAAGVSLMAFERPVGAAQKGALAAFVAALSFFPFGEMERTYIHGSIGRWMGPEDRLLEVRESRDATLALVRHHRDGLAVFDQLATNSYSMSSDDFAARRYMKLFAYLPVMLHSGMKDALAIGFGLGSTVEALTAARELEHIDVVDTSPDTLALSRSRARFAREHPLDDARVRVHIEDGRHFLAGTSARYDLITGEPPPPFLAGVESLYSQEYFSLIHSRLREGGFATYWLPIINISREASCSIVQAFCRSLEQCALYHGAGPNFMLVGRRGHAPAGGLARYVAPFADAEQAAELEALGIEHPAQVAALFIGDEGYLTELCEGVEPLRDEFPRAMQAGSGETRSALLGRLRNTEAARQRFYTSRTVADFFPAAVMRDAAPHFEGQRLLDDLLWSNPNAHSLAVLEQVVHRTPLRLPVLLLLGSDPDAQQALAAVVEAPDEPAALRVHRLAGALADRDFAKALTVARTLSPSELPLPGLLPYLERALHVELADTR